MSIRDLFKKKEVKYTIRKTLTDEQRSAARVKFSKVKTAIYKYEQENNIKVLASSEFIEEDYYNEDSYKENRIRFFGQSGAKYTMPLIMFMTIPEQRIVLGVTRALMIGYNRSR